MDDDETDSLADETASMNFLCRQLERIENTRDEAEPIEDTQDETYRSSESFAVNLSVLHKIPENIVFEKKDWLQLHDAFIKPPKMCSVNQFVHIVSKIGHHYLSSSCELVLFGTGNSMPEHFRWMIYCMEMVMLLFRSVSASEILFCR